MTKLQTPRWAWVLTGSGHFFVESFELIRTLEHCDIFVSKAANEVLRMYKLKLDFPDTMRVLHDKTASAVPVGGFYHGIYHTVVIAPATSNTVAKCVVGISDTLATNVYAQAGKCQVPSIVFACDTAPELETMAPGGMVKVYPRPIDLQNTARLKEFERTHVVESLLELKDAIARRQEEIAGDG
ncbi:flavoprotein [Phyllobacterium salinisoli]|uniref:Flavoprotein n=1 Tax=Phyllobacterium salinisoli TaxID=1899321 RepID=A0A368K4X8_9HYPH|nr:flavoprotein [Phyllobacterium salinisoli]RCS24447.1 flavoprotein [Phyllobacterium salinisoli]